MQPDGAGSNSSSLNSSAAKTQPRGPDGRFVKADGTSKSTSAVVPVIVKVKQKIEKPPEVDNTPPLVSFKITNPVTYLKLWWKKVMRNEGIDFRFRIHPVTAVVLTLVILGGTFSFGFVISALQNVPVVNKFIPTPTPVPATPNPFQDTAYTGILRETSDGKFYLQTVDAQAITLSIPENVSLMKFVGKRILASGVYNTDTGVMVVQSATDLEVLIQSTAVPTTKPTPIPTPSPTETHSPTPTQTPGPIATPSDSEGQP